MSARPRVLLLPVTAMLFAVAACSSAPVPPPVSAAPSSAAPASTSAAPASTSAAPAPTSAAPTSAGPASASAAPGDRVPATSRAVSTKTSGRASGCPSAKTLEKLADLPADWYFVPSSVECWKGWATADPEGPTPGDGVYLFRYKAGKGWRYHSQGSGYHCKELGINESAPFCQYP